MKKGLIAGIMLMILSAIVCVVCLLLPSMNSHASFEEAMSVFIPSAILFAFAALLTIVSALKARKNAAQQTNGQR